MESFRRDIFNLDKHKPKTILYLTKTMEDLSKVLSDPIANLNLLNKVIPALIAQYPTDPI